MYKNNQQGMTAIGWLIVLGLIAFFALIILRMAPIYLESFKVKSALESLKQEPHITRKDKMEIMKLMENRFMIDDVDDVNLRKDMTVSKDNGVLTVSVKYEVRKHLVGNVDVVANFNPSVKVVAR